MRALLAKKYINDFDLKQISKDVFELFDDYNYKKELAQQYLYESMNHELNDIPSSHQRGKSNPTSQIAIKREKLLNYLDEFDTKLKYLKLSLTDDELKILNYGIGERETDKELMDRICKSYKTYLLIKKSCYVKIALRFNLVKSMEKTILKTISITD